MKTEHLSKCNLCGTKDILPIDKDHNIFRCSQCGYIFDNPRPTCDEIANFYSQENRYDSWLEDQSGREALWERRLEMVRRLKSKGALLDVGAGIGRFLHLAKDHFQVEGTEVSETAIELARKKYGLSLRRGHLEDIDLGERRFDVITLFHVLEHVPDPSRTLERCYNLLKEKGVIVIAVPNDIDSFIKNPFKRILSILQIGRFRRYGVFGLPKIELDGSLVEIHVSHFTVSSLKSGLTKKGFVVVQDTLDPFYAATGIQKAIHDLLYRVSLILKKMTNHNPYYTIWIAAER